MSEFNGTVVLTDVEFDRMVEHMNAPSEPTEAIVRGAALLRKLYSAGTEIEVPLLNEARSALQRIDARANEDIDAWATEVGNDLGSFQD